MLIPLLIGVAIGLGALLALAVVYGQRGEQAGWRGATNAVAVGLGVGAMFDLMPIALEHLTVLVGTFFRVLFVDVLALQNSPLGLGGAVITQAAVPVGALLILFLYLTGNTLPMQVGGKLTGTHTTGWRARLFIPEVGTVDWLSIGLVTVGLGCQNLWVAQMRGTLVSPDDGGVHLFAYVIGLVGALRGLALFGPLVNPLARVPLLVGCVLVIAVPVLPGVLNPDTMGSVALGVLPALCGVVVLAFALGRLLRVMQVDIGMNWQATLIVLVALGLERGSSTLLARLAQGQF